MNNCLSDYKNVYIYNSTQIHQSHQLANIAGDRRRVLEYSIKGKEKSMK